VRLRRFTVPISLAAILCASAPVPGQETPTFTEQVEVRVMDLDVVVTDRDGRPVPDLKREDFTVRLAGKPVPIDYFARIDQGAIRGPDLATAAPDQVAGTDPAAERAWVPRYFLVFVDIGHITPIGRTRAFEALRDFIARMGPNDRARIVVFDRRPRPVTQWLSSKEALSERLSRIEKEQLGMSRLTTERQTLHDIDFPAGFSGNAGRMQLKLAENYAEQERAEVRQMLQGMRAELTSLAPLAGKKVFLFLSGGFEFQPGYAMLSYVQRLQGAPNSRARAGLLEVNVPNFSQDLEKIVRRANASEITFYTVDARGLEAGGMGIPISGVDESLQARSDMTSLARADTQEGLVMLARETGGLALLNSNDFEKGLTRVHEDTSVYYSLGVTLSKVAAVGYQQVRVDVNRPGVTVRTRQGYSALTEAERSHDRVEATMQTNLSYSAIPVTLRTAPAVRAGRNFSLPVSITFPASALTFVPDGGSGKAAAELWIGAVDDEGRSSDVTREEKTFTQPGFEPDAPLTYRATLRIRKGSHRVVVNVRDTATGRMGTAKANVRVD
jgi:VWFA-related protein